MSFGEDLNLKNKEDLINVINWFLILIEKASWILARIWVHRNPGTRIDYDWGKGKNTICDLLCSYR